MAPGSAEEPASTVTWTEPTGIANATLVVEPALTETPVCWAEEGPSEAETV